MLRVILSFSFLVACAFADDGYAILQGASGNGTAQFSLLVPAAQRFTIIVKPGDGTSVRKPDLRERISEGTG